MDNLSGFTTPPQNLDAEKALLGFILLNKQILDDVADQLKPDFFYLPVHTLTYKIMLELWASSRPVDILTLLNEVKTRDTNGKDKNLFEEITENYLLELTAKSTLASSPAELTKIIKDEFLLRTIIQTADEIKNLAAIGNSQPNDLLDIAQKKLYEVSLTSIDRTFTPIQEILETTFERISEMHQNQVEFRGVPTGFTDLDKVLDGFHKSDLVIIAGRPSMGKTAFALEIIKGMALQAQVGVAFFSLEMSKDQLVDRLLASVAQVDLWKIKTSKFGAESENNEFAKLGAAIGQLDQAPIWIDDSGGLNILELRSKARRLKTRHNVGVIVIDYLQLMSGGGKYNGNRVQEVAEISRGLKMLARELDIPVVALSQLSRGVEGRDDKRPMLSDLRESGSIEQDADVVMFLHREEMYNRETTKKGIADVIIAKHRNGQTGAVELAWIHKLATFGNLDGAKIHRRINQ